MPSGYKSLVDIYGLGLFDGFLWVLQPTTSNPHLRLDKQIELWRSALDEVGETFARPADLIGWAITENGDCCYWLTREHLADPDKWPIAVNESRGPEWDESDLSTEAWIEAVLAGRLKASVFPTDFPSGKPVFRHEEP